MCSLVRFMLVLFCCSIMLSPLLVEMVGFVYIRGAGVCPVGYCVFLSRNRECFVVLCNCVVLAYSYKNCLTSYVALCLGKLV